MIKLFTYTLYLVTSLSFVACVPIVPSQPSSSTHGGIGGARVPVGVTTSTPSADVKVVDRVYGAKPLHYSRSIPLYFSTKLARAEKAIYKYAEPKRAYKRKGFAYGGEVSWRGWLVETSIALPNRAGRMLTPKPYMVLFNDEQIVEHILGYSHKLITKVDK